MTAPEPRDKRHRRIVRAPSEEAVLAAERVRRELGLSALEDIDVVLIGAHYGLTPIVRDLEHEEAHVIRAGERGVVCIARRVWESGVWRFVFAHELGHWLLDRDHDDFARCTSSEPRGARRKVESIASDFAGLLLVPGDIVAARWDLGAPGLAAVEDIARASGVGVSTAALRVLQLTTAPRAVAFSSAGKVEWWAETRAFGARVRAGRRVPEGCAAAGLHDARATTEGDAWNAGVRSSAARIEGGDAVVSWLEG